MEYSIDYPDHELTKFIGQTFTRRHELHRVYCAMVLQVKKLYNEEGKPYRLIFSFVNGEELVIDEHSEKLNNPDYTINGATIGVKPNETQQALRDKNQKASRLERALKKIHDATEEDRTNSTPPKPKPKSINDSFEAIYSVDSWDTGTVTNLSHKTLKVSAENPRKALEIATKCFNAPDRDPAIIDNNDELVARWYSDDACEEIGSEITITIRFTTPRYIRDLLYN